MNILAKAAIAGSLLASASFVQAAEYSGNVTLNTDYTFRGISQTDEKASISGGFDAAYDSGFYAGVWASNVDFGTSSDDTDSTGGSIEIDYYVGFAGEISENVGYDVAYIYYDYPSISQADYQELALALSFGDLGLGVNYSDAYGGEDGNTGKDFGSFYYVWGDYSVALGEASLDFHVGYNHSSDKGFFENDDFEASKLSSDTDDTYVDWSIGISQTFGGIDVGLTYVDTDLDDTDAADSRVVFSLSKAL